MKNSDKNVAPAADTTSDQATAAVRPALPTAGGLYEFEPKTRTMRTLEGGAADAAGGGNDATTGEQA